MNYTNILAIMDGSQKYDLGNGAISALLSILIVFSVLLIIIGITTLVFKLLGLFEMKAEIDKYKQEKNNVTSQNNNSVVNIDTNDDDLMAAILVATIDYRQEIKQDVKVISVKEIK